ncbi:MAG TPA: ribonuclease III domain-containing protein, partial [Cytophagaceae bacterium]
MAKESGPGIKNSYERLEYLGDAILGAVVAEFLFKKFPYKNEGFLTEIRSRIVNRESLNQVGKKIGLTKIV